MQPVQNQKKTRMKSEATPRYELGLCQWEGKKVLGRCEHVGTRQ